MPRKSRKWPASVVRRKCVGCGTCMGKAFTAPEGVPPGGRLSHGICKICARIVASLRAILEAK